MIDSGGTCSNVVSYVQALGITTIDYHFATHYHADHIRCLDDLVDAGITVGTCYDRGGSRDTNTFNDYVAACGFKRQTATKGQVTTLSGGATITVVDLNGAGISTSDENALSMVMKLTYGDFDHVFAGDLTDNIESVVGPQVGDVEVCKVSHHGSKSSTTDNWLDAIDAEVCVVSVGNNGFGHPTLEAMERLHAHEIKVYWTNTGDGVAPDPAFDKVGGTIVIEALPGSGDDYTVSGTGFADTYTND